MSPHPRFSILHPFSLTMVLILVPSTMATHMCHQGRPWPHDPTLPKFPATLYPLVDFFNTSSGVEG